MAEPCPFDGQARSWLDAEAEAGLRQALTMPGAMSNLQDRHEGKLQDRPPQGNDNRVVNIFVIDGETKELINKVKERTGKLIDATE